MSMVLQCVMWNMLCMKLKYNWKCWKIVFLGVSKSCEIFTGLKCPIEYRTIENAWKICVIEYGENVWKLCVIGNVWIYVHVY